MNKPVSILFVGVGGQGTILASKILTEALLEKGYDVKMTEVHGMAQRGGSVTTEVRFGEKVYSPLIEKGNADIIVAFEKSEAVRYLGYLKKGGTIVANDYEIYPVTVTIGEEKYPENVDENLKKAVPNTYIIKAAKMAEDLGNIKAQNVVLLGALVSSLNLTGIHWENVIEKLVPAKAVQLNKKAFKLGYESLK